MTLQERARQAYERTYIQLITCHDSRTRDEAIWELNFLQRFCQPDFLMWARRSLPFFTQFELEGIMQRHEAILGSLEMWLREMQEKKEQEGGE